MVLFEIISCIYLLVIWFGYSKIAPRVVLQKGASLNTLVGQYVDQWMRLVPRRKTIISDVAIMGNAQRNCIFFASTAILLLAGLISLMQFSTEIVQVIKEIPLASFQTETYGVIAKLGFAACIFVYAFFTFTWSMRQWSFATYLVASIHDDSEKVSEKTRQLTDHETLVAKSASKVIMRAVVHFNYGLRAYYFGLASITWLIGPLFFMLVSTIVLIVLIRREFFSKSNKALYEGIPFFEEINKQKMQTDTRSKSYVPSELYENLLNKFKNIIKK